MDQSKIKWCVFCGGAVEGKTKEHVIPQWLMKMTGDPKRKVSLFSFLPHNDINRYREIAFNSIHFPACDGCNNNFAKLEDKAKVVMEKVVTQTAIGHLDWMVLLDWLDKVRIGVWLGTRYMDKNFVPIEPNFYIADRVGTKDRSLVIVKSEHGERLSFLGTNSLTFRFMPSCFGILVNNIGLVNISHDFLLARRLGFPFAEDLQAHESGLMSYVPAPGQARVMRPPLTMPATAFGTAIHQCVYKDWEKSTQKDLWETPYVRSNTIDPARGLSALFFEDEKGCVDVYPSSETTHWVPRHTFKSTAMAGQHVARTCLKLQEKLLDSWTIGAPNENAKKLAARNAKILRNELMKMRQAISTMR